MVARSDSASPIRMSTSTRPSSNRARLCPVRGTLAATSRLSRQVRWRCSCRHPTCSRAVEDGGAFKAELPKLRLVVRKVGRERLQDLDRHGLPPLQLLQQLKAENAAALQRLEHWDKVLCNESTHEIRSPVRL